jgi:hypothetical protein
MDAMGAMVGKGKGMNNAEKNDPNLGGKKDAERPGANKGMVDHHEVDRIDHGKHHARAKKAMADMGHHNMTYHDGGER